MDRAIRHSSRLRKRGGKNAVTLLELVVVLTILLMLTALLLPITARARVRGRQESCQQNLRRLAQASLMYARDHDDFPPPAAIDIGQEVAGKTWYRGNVYWPMLLLPYVGGDRRVFRCPDAPFDAPPFGPGMEWHTYAINALVAVRIPNHLGLKSRKLSSVRRPDATGLFVDSAGVCLLYEDDFVAKPVSSLSHYYGMSGMGRSTYPSHQNGVNLVFMDGHTIWMPTEAYVGNTEAGRCLWNDSCDPV